MADQDHGAAQDGLHDTDDEGNISYVMEDYDKAVKVFAELTRCQASAKETDPIAWESFIESGGHSETNLPYAGGNRGLNYLEMVKFNRGYWR